MTDVTTDAGSVGSSVMDMISMDLIPENRAEAILWPACLIVPCEKGTDSYAFQELTSYPTMQAQTTGATEAAAGTPQALVTASRVATFATKTAWLLQSWASAWASRINWLSEMPKILGRARADIMDVDAGALHATHTGTAGLTGTDFTLEAARGATVTLDGQSKGGADGACFFLHQNQLSNITAAALGGAGIALNVLLPQVVKTYGDVPGSGVFRAYKGILVGVPVFTSTNIGTMNGGVDYGGSLSVPKSAHGAVEVQGIPPYVTDSQSGNLKPADSHGAIAMYGVVKRRDAHGVTCVSRVPA